MYFSRHGHAPQTAHSFAAVVEISPMESGRRSSKLMKDRLSSLENNEQYIRDYHRKFTKNLWFPLKIIKKSIIFKMYRRLPIRSPRWWRACRWRAGGGARSAWSRRPRSSRYPRRPSPRRNHPGNVTCIHCVSDFLFELHHGDENLVRDGIEY